MWTFYSNSRLFKLNQLLLRHHRSPRSTGRSREACQRNAALHVALIIICSKNYLQLPSSWLTVKLFIYRICWNVHNYRFYFLTPPSHKTSPQYSLHEPSFLKSLFKRFLQASGVCRWRWGIRFGARVLVARIFNWEKGETVAPRPLQRQASDYRYNVCLRFHLCSDTIVANRALTRLHTGT